MSQTSIDTNSRAWPARMRRKMASEYLFKVHGIQLSPATLAKLAVLGGGPHSNSTADFPFMTSPIWTYTRPLA